MPAEVPTSVPSELVAGSTATWKLTFSDYPASDGWTLSYALLSGAVKITFSGSADGDAHLIEVAAATTANWTAGKYHFQAYLTSGSERYDAGSGEIYIRANFAQVTAATDPRTDAERRLEEIEDAIEGLSTRRLSSYTTASGTFTMQSIDGLLRLRDRYKAEVLFEKGTGATHIRARPRYINAL